MSNVRSQQLAATWPSTRCASPAALAPRRIPGRLAGLRALPQHEVERIALRLIHFDAGAGAQVTQLLSGKLAVDRELRHRIHHVTVRSYVRVARVDQRLIIAMMLGTCSVARGSMIRLSMPRRVIVFVHRFDETRRQRLNALAILGSALDDLVVDVGDVADIRDLVTAIREIAPHDVECDFERAWPMWQKS